METAVVLAGATNNLISANAADAGEVEVPVTCTQVPEAVVTVLLSIVESCEPPVQFGLAYHAMRTRALVRLVPVGTNIKPDHV